MEEQGSTNMSGHLTHMYVVASDSVVEAMGVGVGCLFHVLKPKPKS